MPELVHGENCLLAETPAGIAGQIDRALRDPDLRRRIGAAARATYDAAYAPHRVAGRLLQMIDAGLASAGERVPAPFGSDVATGQRLAGRASG
jgi:hypothetical protein